jgi:hypothetical protein
LTGPHEVSDDLESFFWVLLYLVVKCRNSTRLDLSESMRFVFDYHTDMDRGGNVTGGRGKLACLSGHDLGPRAIHSLTQTPCRSNIEGLRTLFHNLYLNVEALDETNLDFEFFSQAQLKRDQVNDARKKLGSSKWILDMMNRYLTSKWDVDDDGSLLKTELCPDSSSKRNLKRKAPDDQKGRITFNAWRKGRLPPSVSVSSGKPPSLMGHRRGPSFTPSSGAPHASGGSLPSRGSKLRSGSRLA